MNLPTQAERDLFDCLSPEGRASVEKCLAALEADPNGIDFEPNKCPQCGASVVDKDNFCDEKCRAEYDRAEAQDSIELMVRPVNLLEPYDYEGDR